MGPKIAVSVPGSSLQGDASSLTVSRTFSGFRGVKDHLDHTALPDKILPPPEPSQNAAGYPQLSGAPAQIQSTLNRSRGAAPAAPLETLAQLTPPATCWIWKGNGGGWAKEQEEQN